MKTIERIKMLISENAKSERDFAMKIGVNQVTLNNYTANKRKLSLEIIEAILNAFPEISAEWLLRGTGSMMLNNNESEVVSSTKYKSHSNTIFIMEETIKNVISDLQYKVDVLKQEKQYLLDMCRNCETCAQRFCCQYCKNKTAKVIAIRIKRK